MKPKLVVDVGNSRIKWGYCAQDRVLYRSSLGPDDTSSWEDQIKRWDLATGLQWAVAGVHPERASRFMAWAKERGDQIVIIQDKKRLPIKTEVEPDSMGIDRLLNAVAAKSRVQREASIFIIDAGSAVTVDWVDENGVFRGGAIFPGFHLMAKALHDYTAALPLVMIGMDRSAGACPTLPGLFTESAIGAGVFWAVAGGIKAITRQLIANANAGRHHVIYLTGGDAKMLATVLDPEVELWPTMTLEGIRIAAEALP